MGRPLVEIRWDEVEKLLELQCTQAEIASWFRCSEDTLSRACWREHDLSFAEYSRLKRGRGRIALRRAQWKAAITGNVTMLIWLGKQHLNQTDKMATAPDELADQALLEKAEEILAARRAEQGPPEEP